MYHHQWLIREEEEKKKRSSKHVVYVLIHKDWLMMMFLVLQHRDNDVIETYLPPLPDSYHNISYGATIAGKTILFSVSLKGVSCVLDRWGVEQCHIRCHERRCKANFTASSWVCVCLQRTSFFSHPTKWSILVPLHTLCKSYENSRLLYVHFVLVSCVWANI